MDILFFNWMIIFHDPIVSLNSDSSHNPKTIWIPIQEKRTVSGLLYLSLMDHLKWPIQLPRDSNRKRIWEHPHQKSTLIFDSNITGGPVSLTKGKDSASRGCERSVVTLIQCTVGLSVDRTRRGPVSRRVELNCRNSVPVSILVSPFTVHLSQAATAPPQDRSVVSISTDIPSIPWYKISKVEILRHFNFGPRWPKYENMGNIINSTVPPLQYCSNTYYRILIMSDRDIAKMSEDLEVFKDFQDSSFHK
jgi:hypothetical protein